MARPLNELSKKTLIDYTDKAANDMLKSDQSGKKSRGDKRFHGLIKAGDKLNAKTRAGIKEEKQMKSLKEILQLDEKKSWKDIIPGHKKDRVQKAAKAHGQKMAAQGAFELSDSGHEKYKKGISYKYDPIEKRAGKYLTGKVSEDTELEEKKSWKDIIPGHKKDRVQRAMSKHGHALVDRGIAGMSHPDKATRKASRDLAYKGADWFKRADRVQGKFLTGKGRKFSVEETQNDGEQLDELSKNTLDSYREKASADLSKRIKSSDKDDKHRAGRRMAGILTARSKKKD